jgi:hypothetical protein
MGTSPLLQHNIQLANPDNEWAKRVAQITAKRKKTEDDRREISRLEFLGSLYLDEGQVVVPKTNVRKCFQEAAKVTKKGKDVARAVMPLPPGELNSVLVYKGPQTVEELVEDQDFYDVTSVGVGQKRVLRTRPIFRAWALDVEWELITTVMDYEVFVEIAELAGRIEGLGDNRVGGYGRFDVEVSHE